MRPDPPIAGQTPLDDLPGLRISGLRIRSIRTTAELNAAEAENIRKATLKYLASRPTRRSARFDISWLRRLHAEMFGDVWRWAGSVRTHETNIGAPPHDIEVRLHTLLEDLKVWEDSRMPLLEQAVRLHHVAVQIHPFANGNGRWSRMAGNIWLKLHGSAPIEWPETTIGSASTIRGGYLEAVRDADKGDYSALLALHERFASRSGE